MENVMSPGAEGGVAITGEVIYESVHHVLNKKAAKAAVHQAVERRLREVPGPPVWASYLVIFSPGQEYEEVRCQVDVETSCERAGFAIGFGLSPRLAFLDAIERMQWYEKNMPLKISV